MKKFTKVLEAYEMEMENYDDFAKEHAKAIISSYLDGELEGESLQSAFAKLVKDNDLHENMQEAIKSSLVELSDEIFDQAENIQFVGSEPEQMTKQQELDAQKKPIGDNPGVM